MSVRVQAEAFDLGREVQDFADRQKTAGALVSFTGVVRDWPGGGLQEMLIEHYPAMTEKALVAIEVEARGRWDLRDALIIHRFGSLKPGAHIMMVATAASHRKAAFEAAEFLMDYLKSRAPFWKKERGSGSEVWVDSKPADEAALKRWE